MVRSIFAAATLVIAGLASFASAASYEDFILDTSVGLTYAAPASSIQTSFGTIDETKAVCDTIDDCIGVIYQASAGGGVLLRYEANGSDGAASGFSSVHWRYDAASGPSCSSVLDSFTTSSGNCQCDSLTQTQNTAFGCSARLLPSGITIERRIKRMARSHIMPGRT